MFGCTHFRCDYEVWNQSHLWRANRALQKAKAHAIEPLQVGPTVLQVHWDDSSSPSEEPTFVASMVTNYLPSNYRPHEPDLSAQDS